MNNVFTNNARFLPGLLAAVLVGLGSTNGWARDHAKDSMKVVQTLSFDGQAGSTMALEEDGGKSYLQIRFASGQEAWVNVTQPEKPLEASPAKPSEERTQINQNLVMVRAHADGNQSVSKEFSLWDISKPKSPRLVGKFTDVSRVIEDQRGYIYVLHRDGLTVIRSKNKNENDNGPDYSVFG
ncbi:MAG TPA: hypothetical protein VKH81_19210 [Candidatus Angelobacter sp.]|nr:hypothetical protein [Candidatus Angelobacter sp.]